MSEASNAVDEIAPSTRAVTDYDRRHFLTYARLLDDAHHGIAWHRTAAALMPKAERQAVRRCYLSHLARAHYLYRDLGGNGETAQSPVMLLH